MENVTGSGNTTQLAVRQWGQGVPAVFVHGALTTGEENWEGQAPLAAEGYRLLVPDRRGYGDSPPSQGEDFVRDGEDVADLLGGGAHLVGHSYGGLAALVAADRRPEATFSLTLLEPPAFGLCPDHPAVAALITDMRDLWARTDLSDREFLEAFLHLVGSSPADLPAEMLAAFSGRVPVLRQVGRMPWEAGLRIDRLADAAFPTLVISGDHHPAFNAVCAELTRRIDARIIAIPGAGHEVQMMTDPCNKALLELWRSV